MRTHHAFRHKSQGEMSDGVIYIYFVFCVRSCLSDPNYTRDTHLNAVLGDMSIAGAFCTSLSGQWTRG